MKEFDAPNQFPNHRPLGSRSPPPRKNANMIPHHCVLVNRRSRPNPQNGMMSDTPCQNANSAPAANPMRNRYTPYICSEQIYERLSRCHQRRIAFCWDSEDELRRWLVGHLHITQRNDIHADQCIAHLQVRFGNLHATDDKLIRQHDTVVVIYRRKSASQAATAARTASGESAASSRSTRFVPCASTASFARMCRCFS